MRIISNFLLLFLLSSSIACSQKVDEHLKYLAQIPPSQIPEIFAPKIISKDSYSEFGSIFNKDATEFFFGIDLDGRTEIRYSQLVGNKWSDVQTILSHENYGFNDPFLSPDEKRLYFISKMSMDGSSSKQDHDIWYVEKQATGWSDPINAGPNINSTKNEYYISFTETGTMYFSSNKLKSEGGRRNFDIYSSQSINGEFQEAHRLDESINTENYEADVFVAPNESYLIFCAKRPDGLGRGDLYISFKNENGTWTKSINMGDKINTEKHELCPFVSNDGKYLFYTSNQDIYWVSSKIIDELRKSQRE